MVDYLNLAASNHFNLPKKIERLGNLSYNLWWTWHHDAGNLFSTIDNALWDEVRHNPVEFLHRVERPQYNAVMDDEAYMTNYASQIAAFDAYMNSTETWFTKEFPDVSEKKIAYFSFEFGLHESLPVYAVYFTVWVADGEVRFSPDVYDRDQHMAELL